MTATAIAKAFSTVTSDSFDSRLISIRRYQE